jgi:hypothetical protein
MQRVMSISIFLQPPFLRWLFFVSSLCAVRLPSFAHILGTDVYVLTDIYDDEFYDDVYEQLFVLNA